MSERSLPSEPSSQPERRAAHARDAPVDLRAERLFVDYVERLRSGEPADFEALCRENPDHAAALRDLKEPWEAAEGLLRRIPPIAPLSARLRDLFGGGVDPEVELAGSKPSSATRQEGELVARLREAGPRGTRYQVLGEVARGGMGAILRVWDGDLRRALAMKVVLGKDEARQRDTPEAQSRALGRFLEEAQITGQLDHPGIVPVHELGLSADGRIYFTMRLVKGVDLRRVFALVQEGREGWNPTRALGVLLRVCEAMSYAHAKGVIHRDLKPANVMVGAYGEVYVMDWGLARVLGKADRHDVRIRPAGVAISSIVETDRREQREETPDSPLVTMDGDVVGTPAYMPPEQASGKLDQLGPHSDVYSLGAMLYQLLAGVMPYTARDVRASQHTVLARVLDGPPRPLIELAPHTPAELVAICEKAMAREPAQRYRDMLELAEDLRAFLEGRVVSAHETGAWAEARKWVRRNKPLAAALAAGVAILVAGLAVSTAQYVRAERNYEVARSLGNKAAEQAMLATREAERAEGLRAQAETARAESDSRARDLREVSEFQASMLGSIDAEALGARLRENVLGEVRDALERLNADEAVVAQRMDEVAALLAGVNFTNAAVSSLEQGVLGPSLDAIDRDFVDQPLVQAELLRSAGNALFGLGRLDSAESALAKARAILRETFGDDHEFTLATANELAGAWMNLSRYDDAERLLRDSHERALRVLGAEHEVTLALTNDLALALKRLGRFDEAEPLYRDALERRRRIDGEDAPDTLDVMHNLASLLDERGERTEAEAMLRDVLERRRRVLGEDDLDTIMTANNLAGVLEDRREFEEAERLLRDCLERRQRILGNEHPRTLSSMNNLGRLLRLRGKLDEAERMLRETVEVRLRILGENHAETLTARSNFAALLRAQGKLAEAEPHYRAAYDGRRTLLGEDHPSTLISGNNLALLLKSKGEMAEAEALARAVVETSRRARGEEHTDTISNVSNLASILRARGKLDEAMVLARDVLDRRLRGDGADAAATLAAMTGLASMLADLRQLDEAERLFRDVLERRTRKFGADDLATVEALRNVGAVLSLQRQYAAAEPLLRDAVERSRRMLGNDHADTLSTIDDLARALGGQGRVAEAETLQRDALERARRLFGDEDPRTLELEYGLAVSLKDSGQGAEAEALLRHVVERRRGAQDDDANLLDALVALTAALLAQEKLDEAEPLLLDCERRSVAIGARARSSLVTTYSRLIRIYDGREAATPGQGWAEKAAEYRAKLAAAGG